PARSTDPTHSRSCGPSSASASRGSSPCFSRCKDWSACNGVREGETGGAWLEATRDSWPRRGGQLHLRCESAHPNQHLLLTARAISRLRRERAAAEMQ